MGLESMSSRMSHLGKNLLLRGEILSAEELMQKIDRVDMQAIARVIERIFNRNTMNLALIGKVAEDDYRKSMNF